MSIVQSRQSPNSTLAVARQAAKAAAQDTMRTLQRVAAPHWETQLPTASVPSLGAASTALSRRAKVSFVRMQMRGTPSTIATAAPWATTHCQTGLLWAWGTLMNVAVCSPFKLLLQLPTNPQRVLA